MKILFFREGKPMLSKKKKIFILVSMVLLLLVTGYLNVALNKKDSNLQASTTTANFFTSCRADKISSRNYQLEIYDNIISTSSDATEIEDAKNSKKDIAAKVEKELILETKISASGYDDVIVTFANENVNVFVKATNGLTSNEVAKILSILTSELNVKATNVKVTPIA